MKVSAGFSSGGYAKRKRRNPDAPAERLHETRLAFLARGINMEDAMNPEATTVEMSEPSRLAGVIVNPDQAFASIARRPRWVPPLLIIIATSLLFMWFFNHRVGWDHFIMTTLANDPRMERLPPDQKAAVLEQQKKILPAFGWFGSVAFVPLTSLIFAGVLMGVFNLGMGSQFKYRNLFSVVSYAWLPGAIHSLISIVIMHLKPAEDFDLQHPTAFNLGAFLPESAPKWLQSTGESIDIFILWCLVLIAVGVRALDRKRSLGTCLIGVLLPWALFVVCKAIYHVIFS
jgi:hypothetical protein